MERHEFDQTSFVAGVVFAALGSLFLVDAAGGLDVDLRWLVPLVLIGLGVGGLVSVRG